MTFDRWSGPPLLLRRKHEPVAQRIATAVDWFAKPHAPIKPPR
jgi:hypothetical protein